jgi:hypothetical protein
MDSGIRGIFVSICHGRRKYVKYLLYGELKNVHTLQSGGIIAVRCENIA